MDVSGFTIVVTIFATIIGDTYSVDAVCVRRTTRFAIGVIRTILITTNVLSTHSQCGFQTQWPYSHLCYFTIDNFWCEELEGDYFSLSHNTTNLFLFLTNLLFDVLTGNELTDDIGYDQDIVIGSSLDDSDCLWLTTGNLKTNSPLLVGFKSVGVIKVDCQLSKVYRVQETKVVCCVICNIRIIRSSGVIVRCKVTRSHHTRRTRSDDISNVNNCSVDRCTSFIKLWIAHRDNTTIGLCWVVNDLTWVKWILQVTNTTISDKVDCGWRDITISFWTTKCCSIREDVQWVTDMPITKVTIQG